jgi:hypothetical protein
MKSFLLLFVASISFFGCSVTQLTPDQLEQTYTHETTIPQKEIKQKVLTFINEKFRSGKSVLQTNDEGILSGNGIVTIKERKGLVGEVLSVIDMEFTFIIKFTENGYKIKWLVKNILANNLPMQKEHWGYYAGEEIINTLKENDKNLFEYINNKNTF